MAKKKDDAPGADVQELVDAINGAPAEAAAEPAAQSDNPAEVAPAEPLDLPPEPAPAVEIAQPVDLVEDSVLAAHIQRQKEGVAEYMPEEELAEIKRKKLLEEMDALNAENAKRWAEQQAEQAKRDAANEADEIRKTIEGLTAQIAELTARAEHLDAIAKG